MFNLHKSVTCNLFFEWNLLFFSGKCVVHTVCLDYIPSKFFKNVLTSSLLWAFNHSLHSLSPALIHFSSFYILFHWFPPDAQWLSSYLQPTVNPQDLTNLKLSQIFFQVNCAKQISLPKKRNCVYYSNSAHCTVGKKAGCYQSLSSYFAVVCKNSYKGQTFIFQKHTEIHSVFLFISLQVTLTTEYYVILSLTIVWSDCCFCWILGRQADARLFSVDRKLKITIPVTCSLPEEGDLVGWSLRTWSEGVRAEGAGQTGTFQILINRNELAVWVYWHFVILLGWLARSSPSFSHCWCRRCW